jgi:hypothetical protein
MKYFVVAVLTVITFLGLMQIRKCNPDLLKRNDSLVAYWSFNEGKGSVLNESSVRHLNGTIHNSSWTKGVKGTALDFNGEDSYVSCADNDALNLTDSLTVEMWIKPDEWVAEDYGIVGKLSEDRNSGWAFQYNGYANLLQFRINIENKTEILSAAAPLTNSWHQIAGTYDGEKIKFYIDGIVRDSKQDSGKIATCINKLIIGKLSELKPEFYFRGVIDEVKVYNKALSESDIKTGFVNRGGRMKTAPKEPIISVINYPQSMFVNNKAAKPNANPEWFYNVRSFTWREIPPHMTLEQARTAIKNFADMGINVIFPEGYRYLFADKGDDPNYFNSLFFEEYIGNLKTIAQACHENGIRLIGHLTACCVLEPYFMRHKDQAMINMKTKEPAFYRRYGTYMMCPNNPDFSKSFAERAERVVKETGMDGLMVDETEWLPADWTICGCEFCRQKFKEKTGYDIPNPDSSGTWANFDDPMWRAWIDFRIKSMGDFLLKVKEGVDRCGSGKLFTGCYCEALYPGIAQFYGMDLEDMCRSFNTTFFECEPSNPWSWRFNVAEAKYYSAFGPCIYLGYSASYSQQFFNWAFARTNGFGLWIWPEVKQVFPYQWEKKWEGLLTGHDVLCNIAIVFSSPTKNLIKKSYLSEYEYMGWAQSLSEAHIPYETVLASGLTSEKLKKYTRIIMPDVACLSDAQIGVLTEYVRTGGVLIATYESSLYNEKGEKRGDFGLRELMGVSYKGISHVKDSLLIQASETTGVINSKNEFDGDIISIADGGKNIRITGTMERSGLPALFLMDFGIGKVIYSAIRPGLSYYFPKTGGGRTGEGGAFYDNRKPAYRDLMVKMATYKMNPLFYTINVPPEIIVHAYLHKYDGSKGFTIHLLNCLGTRSDKYYQVPDNPAYEFLDYPSPRGFIPPGELMKICIKATDVNRAYFISPDFKDVLALNFRIFNGYCEVSLPDLGRYGFIYLAQGEKDPVKEIIKRTETLTVTEFPGVEPFQLKN